MSDDDYDVELETAEKRAHHNALERKRRDHITNSFSSLRDSVPSCNQGEKFDSRAQVLKKAAEYIQFMRHKNASRQQYINKIKQQNYILESQIRIMEKTKATGNYAMESNQLSLDVSGSEISDVSDSELQKSKRRLKKQKFSH
ncbi:Transcription regulator Myc,Myc-type, basic helix-loop-helix (bHLH) domain [Cinara cedri]|uniref:Transcription regulator Myc,Myc-type, basic helix-loop-helix (BHLH) domain n=1 Tax=Cinara cedri TaxID=506608 RepID=A0A5E4MW52_9HEMI|nr:Transcription regulator Myc,Myc-type, basic helix-loop-helix (bHLH) domain [Cinara cedri]